MKNPARTKAKWTPPPFIFSGDYSRVMWGLINDSASVDDLRGALYLVCCRLQELESRCARPWAERDMR